ncbi:MAG: DUF92 domain-containing protein [Gracilimonas sp.]
MLDRWVNIFFAIALVFVFILFGDAQDHRQILTGIFLASLVCVTAFIINWLTVDGATSATIFGSMAYGLGGLTGAAVVLAFFISGSLVSDRIITKEGFLEKKFRRNAMQVWANGFWFSLWIVVWFLSGMEAFLIAAVTSISASTADTWATEIGDKRLKGKARLLTTWEKVPPGTDGGVSFWGTIAALFGSVFITVIFWIFSAQLSLPYLLAISLIGFSGCIIDSYIGARFQNENNKFSKASFFGIENVYVSNNFVNWISAGTASIISLILILIIGI